MNRKNMVTITIVTCISSLIAVLLIAYNSANRTKVVQNKTSPTTLLSTNTENTTSTKPDLEVISKQDEYDKDNNDYYITGEIRNNTNEIKRNVFIRINLYDKDNVLIGDAIDRIDILDAYGTWKFKAEILYDYRKDFSSYRVVELTGY